LDLCRFGISLKNDKADTAARELASYVVANSLLETNTELPEILVERVVILQDVAANAANYPQDMFDEEDEPAVEAAEVSLDDGPQLA
jgi:hypothetical protein